MNIVLIFADDMRWDLVKYMDFVKRQIDEGRAIQMKNGFNQNPVCIPSRTSTLTGNFCSTTGVVNNELALHDFDDSNTIAVALDEAGYTCGHFGKYVNTYNIPDIPYVPPGWTEWWAIADNGDEYYNYDVSVNGEARHYGGDPEDYLTKVISGRAEKFVATAPEPFFAYVTPVAPHMQAIPYPKHMDAVVKMPSLPESFDEELLGDKPKWMQNLRPLTAEDKDHIRDTKRNMIRTIYGLDDLVQDVFATVRARGIMDDTLFIFASDNGYMWGEHRLMGKSVPYLEAVRMPIVIWDPRPGVANDVALMQNVDFAPTFAGVAGITFDCDGMDMNETLLNTAPSRTHVYIEHPVARGNMPGFRMIQSKAYSESEQVKKFTYTKLGDGQEEFYDLNTDPFQLRNIAKKRDLEVYREMLRSFG